MQTEDTTSKRIRYRNEKQIAVSVLDFKEVKENLASKM